MHLEKFYNITLQPPLYKPRYNVQYTANYHQRRVNLIYYRIEDKAIHFAPDCNCLNAVSKLSFETPAA